MIFDRLLLGSVLSTAVLLSGGCADFSRGAAASAAVDASATDGAASETGGVSSDAALSFATDVHHIVTATCQPCHAQGQQAGGTGLVLTGDPQADYAAVLAFVDTSAAAASRLLAKMSGNGHGGGTLYAAGTPEYQTVLRWIQEGALR